AFSNQVIQHGAVGEDVIELQTRLKHLGFFTGKVDGVFGWRTYWALRNFQYEFGMKTDGIAGTSTTQNLSKASKYDKPAQKPKIKNQNTTPTSTSTPARYSGNDIKVLANADYGESRGEPDIGQVAVAAVILNRVEIPAFLNSISGVIFAPLAVT